MGALRCLPLLSFFSNSVLMSLHQAANNRSAAEFAREKKERSSGLAILGSQFTISTFDKHWTVGHYGCVNCVSSLLQGKDVGMEGEHVETYSQNLDGR